MPWSRDSKEALGSFELSSHLSTGFKLFLLMLESMEAVNINFAVFGLIRLGIKPESTGLVADARAIR